MKRYTFDEIEPCMYERDGGEWVTVKDVVNMSYKEWKELQRKYKESHHEYQRINRPEPGRIRGGKN